LARAAPRPAGDVLDFRCSKRVAMTAVSCARHPRIRWRAAMRNVRNAALVAGVAMLAGSWPAATTATDPAALACIKPASVQRLVFSAAENPNVRRHFRRAVLRRGWPRRLVLNRRGADERRERLLRDIPTREGFDRDEYPPAVGRGRGAGLERGRNPRGWKADVRYVPSSENRSHGASLGAQLEPFCNGTRFRYVFR
jgi:hypothetical protein